MQENESVNTAGNIVTAILFVSLFLGVMLLAVIVVMPVLINANTQANGITYSTVTVTNETGYANGTGYIFVDSTRLGYNSPTLVVVSNRSDKSTVPLGNFTVSAAGVLYNKTANNWNNLSITYTYKWDTTTNTTTNSGISTIQDSVVGMVVQFFSLAPTIGTIFAVVILIAGIVLLVLYVRRMKDSGQSQTSGFQG